jgi:hypothetical protein
MAIICSIQGKDWVLGMEWLTYDDPVSREDLRAESHEMESPWYALRENESVFQCGFCPAIDDIERPKNLASLAAMLADVRQQPWLGVFELDDDLFWYVAIRDHYAIQLGGDVVGTEEEVNAAALKHSGFGGWNREHGTLEKLSQLVSEAQAKRNKRTPVQSFAVSRIDPVPVAIAAGVLAVIGVVGAVGYHLHAHKVLEARLQAAEAEQAKLAARQRVPDADEVLSHTPAPSAWIQACGDGMSSVPYSVDGWTIEETECDSSSIKIKWKRGAGATVANAPAAVISGDGNSTIQSIPMKLAAAAGADNSADVAKETRALLAWGQAHNVVVTIGAPQAISARQKEGWTIPVTIPMPASPFVAGADLDQLPGLRIFGLGPNMRGTNGANGAGGAWSLTGMLYARQ